MEASWTPHRSEGGSGDLSWNPPTGGDREPFTLELDNGKLSTLSTPSSAELTKLGEIAVALGAQIGGEEGETIDPSEVPDTESRLPGCGYVLYPLAVGGILLFLYWRFG